MQWLSLYSMVALYTLAGINHFWHPRMVNIQMATDYSRRHNPYTWLAILRLPIQVLLIFWAWQFTKRS